MRPRPDYSLYLVTDRPLCLGRDLIDIVLSAVAGGATMVQLREKHAGTRDFVALAKALKAALAPFNVPLLINDRVDVALAAGADGVHIGQSDMPAADVRRLIGPDMLLGLSMDTPDNVREAATLDLDYLGLGPVFATATKSDAGAPWGLAGLSAILPEARQPVVGIGGIDLANAADVVRAGAEGVAVVSAICSAKDPAAASAALLAAVRSARP